MYKNLASAPSIPNFERAYCIEKITIAMNFVLNQIFTHLSNPTYGTPLQKPTTPPTSLGASPADDTSLHVEIGDLCGQLASKEREIQHFCQSETVQYVGLAGCAKDSANFILSQQRQDAMNYAKPLVVKTKIVGQLFPSRKFFSSSVSWMIHSAMIHTYSYCTPSLSSPTKTNLHIFPCKWSTCLSSITQDWFAVA